MLLRLGHGLCNRFATILQWAWPDILHSKLEARLYRRIQFDREPDGNPLRGSNDCFRMSIVHHGNGGRQVGHSKHDTMGGLARLDACMLRQQPDDELLDGMVFYLLAQILRTGSYEHDSQRVRRPLVHQEERSGVQPQWNRWLRQCTHPTTDEHRLD